MSTTSNALTGLRFLRPYLCKDLQITHKSAYVRFFDTTCTRNGHRMRNLHKAGQRIADGVAFRGEVNERIEELKRENSLEWPRIIDSPDAMTCREFLEKYKHLRPGQTVHDESVVIRGRLRAFRIAGKGLVFLDLVQEGAQVQAVCNLGKLDAFSGVFSQKFRTFYHLIQRGDVVSVHGNPYTTKAGEISVSASELPMILSPSLASLPRTLEDRETRIRNRHVDMLVNNDVADALRARSHIIQYIRDFLLKDSFIEVQTPVIADKAGGAIAKPFTTVATEFSEKQLALRIAPEIWLKRMIIGGMDRVFEIGPAFRNEGIDGTHNPEFTTCEFYKSFAELEELMSMTEKMFSGLAALIKELRQYPLKALPEIDASLVTTPFARIQFIPAIEKALRQKLPNLAADNATEELIAIFMKKSLPVPTSPTLPRLLDKLASIYIEPHCTAATFIVEHPSCMAPLAKSFLCPKTKQYVSARAELFIQNRELANMYEEENSPFEQRAKFVQQSKYRDDENKGEVDESYLEALEWGLPPTGGWGAGIDRIVMLFCGANRISDVLAFGSLRNVVNLGSKVEGKKETDVVEEIDIERKNSEL